MKGKWGVNRWSRVTAVSDCDWSNRVRCSIYVGLEDLVVYQVYIVEGHKKYR